MEFNLQVYKTKLDNFLQTLSNKIQEDLDTPEWVGTLTSLDIVPSNGNLYPLEINTNIYFILDSVSNLDLKLFAQYLKDNNYKRCILRIHGNDWEWVPESDDVYKVLKNLFQDYNVELVFEWQGSEILSYERELETDFILQQRWNNNFVDRLAADKTLFFNFLKQHELYNLPELKLEEIENYNYDLDYPSFFYKNPNLDIGKGVYPVIVDNKVEITDDPIQVGIQADTYAGCRVEFIKTLIIGKTFTFDVSSSKKEYFILPQYKKVDPYPTELTTSTGQTLYSNFEKSINTHLIAPPNILEGSLIEMADGTFKEISTVAVEDIVKFYKFKNFTKINNEYFLNHDVTFYDKYTTEFTWIDQDSYIIGETYKDFSFYEPLELPIKGIRKGRCYKKSIVNGDLSFIKDRHLVYFTNEFNYFRHNLVSSLRYGGKFLNSDGTDYIVNDYVEELGTFDTYGLIVNQYDLFIPYFINLNGTLILTF